jgi:Tfp pilus assembly protein PilV
MEALNRKKQKGIGIIEVLIAAVIFALGSIAIIQLQGVYFKSSGAAHSRSLALNLAEEKLEDLRGFEVFDDADLDIFDFTSIGANSGGQCDTTDDNACVLTIPSGSVTLDNTIYNRTWAVTNYYYNAGALTTTASGNIAQKDITVTITWTDADGTAQTATAHTIINANDVASGGTLVSNAGGSGESPQVPYTPSTDDSVTPITVGADSKRETLVPTSETDSDGYIRSKFTAYTYNSSNVLIRQEEFQNIACNCRFDGTSATGSETYTAAYPEWNTSQDTYIDKEGDLVTGKVQGCVQGGGNNCAANPDALCEVCCRDHHDMTGVTRKYDPFRSSNDFDSGNHKHYNGTTAVTSGAYLESCCMKRVDGYWRVFQDWNLVNLETIPAADLSDSSIKTAYATYVNSIIDAHIDQSIVAGESLSSPPTQPASIDHNVSANYLNLSSGNKTELSGRAIYLDYIDSTHLTAIQTKKTASEDYLLHVPFYEVEVGAVTDWSSADAAVVKTGPYDGPGSSNDLINEELAALSTDTDPVIVTGSMKKSNSGLTDLNFSVDYNASTNADDETRSDTVTVCVGCSATPSGDCTAPWGATVTDTNFVVAYQASTVVSPASCVSETRTCSSGTLSGSYANASCSVITAQDCTAPWGATVADGSSVTAYLDATPTSSCTSESRTCSAGTLSGSYTNQSCTVTPVTCGTSVSGKTASSGDSVTITSNSGDTGTCTTTGKNYSCSITTATSASITVTSNSVNKPLSTTCGIQSGVNF